MRARLALLILGSAALGGCAYGYGGYGSHYSGISVGIGYGSGYGGYGSGYGGYCSPYGYGYGPRYGCIDPYWGWYGGYYYPGTGYYVYDRYRRPFRWTDRQRRYWSERRHRAQAVTVQGGSEAPVRTIRPNWEDFDRGQEVNRPRRSDQSGANRGPRSERIQSRDQAQPLPQTVRPETVRPERPARRVREGASERRLERRSDRRGRRTVDE